MSLLSKFTSKQTTFLHNNLIKTQYFPKKTTFFLTKNRPRSHPGHQLEALSILDQKTTQGTTFWNLIFDLLLNTFSHFAGTDFCLVLNVLVYHILNEKNHPRGPEASPARPIFFLDVSKLRKVKHAIPLERYHEKHASRRSFGRFFLCFYDDDSHSRFLEIPCPTFYDFWTFPATHFESKSDQISKIWLRLFRP